MLCTGVVKVDFGVETLDLGVAIFDLGVDVEAKLADNLGVFLTEECLLVMG